MRTSRRSLCLLATTVLLTLPVTAFATSSPLPVLGQVISENSQLDGVRVPSGTTLLADSLLLTHAEPVLVHLRGGRVLWLDSHSSAYFEETPTGDLKMNVRSGQLRLRGPAGHHLTVGQNNVAVLSKGWDLASKSGRASSPRRRRSPNRRGKATPPRPGDMSPPPSPQPPTEGGGMFFPSGAVIIDTEVMEASGAIPVPVPP